ncbi:uncharacterized protein ACNS7B_021225 isoform 1-T2 [Menidia menidia]
MDRDRSGTGMSALRFLFLTFLLAVDSVFSAEGQRIRAEAGQDSVTLPCGAGEETQITVVGWIRLDLDPDVLHYIDGHFESDHQHPSFRNRVDLQDRQMKDGNVSLILKDVTINDTGTYLCIVTQGEDRRLISSIYLDVVSGQRIRAEAGQDSVTLPCGAGKETQIRAVEWSRPDLYPDYVVLYYIDGLFESDHQHPSFRNRVDLQDRQMKDGNVSLILKNVTLDDTGIYLCARVTDTNLKLDLISSIYLDVSLPAGKLSRDEELRRQRDLLSGLAAVVVILVSIVYIYWSWGKHWRQKKLEGEVRELQNKLRAAEQRLMETARLDLQLSDAKMEAERHKRELQRVKVELEEQTKGVNLQLKDAKMEAERHKKELQRVKAELEEQTGQLIQDLKDAEMEIRSTKRELQMQKTELETTKTELQRVKAELEEKNQPSQELEDAEMKAE